jgi:hypothetical protein
MSALTSILTLSALLFPAPKISPDERFYTEQSSEAYQRTFDELNSKGWRLKRIKGYEKNGASRFDSEWHKPTDPPIIWSFHDIDRDTYDAKTTPLKNNRYVEVLKSTWKVNGKDYFWTMWERGDEK